VKSFLSLSGLTPVTSTGQAPDPEPNSGLPDPSKRMAGKQVGQ